MILPDGYSDVPAGKIAAVVTHLEMTDRPALAPGPEGTWTLRRVAHPGLDWFRGLYRRIGEEWLWFSRIRMSDLDLAAKIHSPLVEVYALVDQGCDDRWLMSRALERAWSQAVTRVWLHTCSFDHPGALAFYQRCGFRPFRRQIEVSADPRLDCTAPRHVASHVPIVA